MSTSEIKIGALATLVGPFAALGEDSMRGVELAIAEFGGMIAGKRLTLIKESSNAIPDDAYYKAKRLVEEHQVDFMIGPLSGNEGLAVRDYAKTQPEKVFLNGTAAAQDITLRDPAPNFYCFNTHSVQWVAGLGTYAYEVQRFRRVVTVAEAYSVPFGQVAGFMIEFCRLGGQVLHKSWVALGTIDFTEVIAAIPKDCDAIFVALGGTDAIKFLQQYYDVRGGTLPLIGGPITVDQTILSTTGELSDKVVGMASSGPTADNDPDLAWQTFVSAYRKQFPNGLPSPSLCGHGYYVNTKAALLALQSVNGDLSNGQARFKEALRQLEFDTPTGPVRLDHNRAVIATIFLSVVDRQPDGTLYKKLVKKTPNVTSTMGIPEEDYLKLGSFGTNNPTCERLAAL
jgi:branched-chain amino acid transport system substrate-binding protein